VFPRVPPIEKASSAIAPGKASTSGKGEGWGGITDWGKRTKGKNLWIGPFCQMEESFKIKGKKRGGHCRAIEK